MGNSRLSAALTLFGLLAFATSAAADCAWVLWNMLNITKTGAGDRSTVHHRGRVRKAE